MWWLNDTQFQSLINSIMVLKLKIYLIHLCLDLKRECLLETQPTNQYFFFQLVHDIHSAMKTMPDFQAQLLTVRKVLRANNIRR